MACIVSIIAQYTASLQAHLHVHAATQVIFSTIAE